MASYIILSLSILFMGINSCLYGKEQVGDDILKETASKKEFKVYENESPYPPHEPQYQPSDQGGDVERIGETLEIDSDNDVKIESQEEVSQEGIKEKPMQSLEELYAEMDNHEPIYQPFDSIHYTIENFRENLVEEHDDNRVNDKVTDKKDEL